MSVVTHSEAIIAMQFGRYTATACRFGTKWNLVLVPNLSIDPSLIVGYSRKRQPREYRSIETLIHAAAELGAPSVLVKVRPL
jgi:hypothetical protein